MPATGPCPVRGLWWARRLRDRVPLVPYHQPTDEAFLLQKGIFMDPTRLNILLSATLMRPWLSATLSRGLALQATRQLLMRWPLVGCVIHSCGTPTIIAVGRQ